MGTLCPVVTRASSVLRRLTISKGTLEKTEDGFYKLGENKFVAISGLRKALPKCIGLRIHTVGEPMPAPMYLPVDVKAVKIVTIALPDHHYGDNR